MPSSTFTRYQDLSEQMGKGVHNFASHVLKIAFTNAAPNVATHAVLADISQISTGGGYTGGAGGGLQLDGVTYIESSGVSALAAIDETFVASGGSVGPFRYVVLYNDTPTSPADPLIGYWDYGSSITLGDGEPFVLDLGANIITLS